MPSLLHLAGALAGLAILAALHVVFWRWWLAAPTREDEVIRARTRDGWSLALGRRLPGGEARGPPVLLVHGIAMNRQAFDFGVERWSVSRALSGAGFDCFALDLRGHGGSRRGPGGRWNFDTYLREDLPAAFEAIRAATGSSRVLYVGHSQGALLGMAACALHADRIAGLVAIAPPARLVPHAGLRVLAGLSWGAGRFLRLLAGFAAPFAGRWHPRPLDLTANLRNVDPPIYRRFLANGVEDLRPGVLEQFAAFVREDSFRSMDGKTDYRALASRCTQPALFVSGERDGLTPPACVEAAFAGWGGPKRHARLGPDFGHTDLLLGRSAPEVVFPLVRDFLLEQSEGSLPAGPARP